MARRDAGAAAGAVLLLAAMLVLGQAFGWRQGAAWVLGGALGFVLFQASFGFTGAYRRLFTTGEGAGVRAQLVMIALTMGLFLPILASGSVLGTPVRGFVFPIGIGLLVGAFLFGVGMQLGGGCGSGTLYSAGGGQGARMWVTLAFFIIGATLAAWQSEGWAGWPALAPVSLPDRLGTWPAMLLGLAVLGAAWAATRWLERARTGRVAPLSWQGGHWLRGPWPLLWGVAGLALLNALTLSITGRPWAITAAFPLWGAKLVEASGIDDPAFWPFWEDPTRTEALLRPLLADRIGVMDLGLMAGAAIAALLAGRGAAWALPAGGALLASVLGGLLLGVGATLGFGCNISAFVGGVASGSLHGWVWIVPALLGNWVGVKLRPLLGI
jgi:uncharacterized membrane protein YedE/YeeE